AQRGMVVERERLEPDVLAFEDDRMELHGLASLSTGWETGSAMRGTHSLPQRARSAADNPKWLALPAESRPARRKREAARLRRGDRRCPVRGRHAGLLPRARGGQSSPARQGRDAQRARPLHALDGPPWHGRA